MAGFFGLFNYEKEGPGIEKNAPKKKTFLVFFETFFRNFWKFISINIVYNLISIPVITNGFACVGITNVTRNIARDKHSFGLSDFFETIMKNWKQALGAGIINTLVVFVLAFDIWFFYNQDSESMFFTVLLGITFGLCLLFAMMNFYIWTLMITFDFSLKQIYLNSFKFVVINLKNNFFCMLSLIAVYALYVGVAVLFFKDLLYVLMIEALVYILTYPAFKFLLIQFFVFPSIKKHIIDPYYAAHPDEDLEKRRNLGIEIDEQPDQEENDVSLNQDNIGD